MKGIYLALGSNLGDRRKFLSRARVALMEAGIDVLKTSRILETEPLGGLDQPKYLNMVIEVESDLAPRDLLKKCLRIEEELGRERHAKWGARTIDIDILLFGNQIIDSPDLKIPHPEIHNRGFVLQGLRECGAKMD